MVIPELDVILAGSPYEDALANYKKFFEQSRIVTIQDLENCPRYAGANLCGHSTYEFIAFVRDATINYEEPAPVAAPKKARKSRKKAVVEPEPEVVELEIAEPVTIVEPEAVEEDAQEIEKE